MKTFPIPSKPAPSGGEDKPAPAYAKGGDVQACSYAQGGPVLGRTREFLKEPAPFFDDRDHPAKARRTSPEDQEYEKHGKGAKGRDKSLKTVMPRQ